MLYRFLTLLFIFLSVMTVNPILSQELKYRSDIITRENGLSNSSVSCIIKDKYGFLWIGTWNGLNRYDGYDMTVFQHNPADSLSLSNSNINSLYEDKDGLIWIATDDGLNCYNQITGKFKHYYFRNNESGQELNQLNGLAEDEDGLIWIGCLNGGLISLEKASGRYQLHLNSFSERSNTIFAILADKIVNEYIWIGTADGLFRYNRNTRLFERKIKGVPDAIIFVQVINQDNQGNIYLGTWGNGLIKYDQKKATLSSCSTPGKLNNLDNLGIVRAMSFDGKGNLVFILRDKGLMRYNLGLGTITRIDAPEINNDLNNKAVNSIFIEPSGIIWVGTLYDGVIKVVSLINSFSHYNTEPNVPDSWNGGGVSAILEDAEGKLWMGTVYGGLYKIDRRLKKYTTYKQKPEGSNGISSNSILSLIEVKNGSNREIWIGTDGGGLNCLDPVTGKFKIFKSNNGKGNGPSSNSVSSIIQYDKDHLLIGTRDRNLGEGMDVFNMKTGRFINLRYDPSDSMSLGSNNVLKLFKDRTGVVWVGTRNGGLNKFIIRNINTENPKEIGVFIRYTNNPLNPKSLRNNTIYAIHDDAKHNLWIGTNDGGISKFDPSSGTFTTSVLDKYMKDHLVYGILSDDDENLWISTSRGIISINLTTNSMHTFDKYNGLQETAFIYGSYFKSPSGELFFGGIKGCNSFHPDSVKINLKLPEIVITSMIISGKRGAKDVSQLTGKSVIASNTVKTPYYQNNFSFSFTALDYQMPAKNRFQYMLEGYDKTWTEADAKRRYVNYTNLPPGKYIFRVIGTNSDEIWNSTGTAITIYITPPFWKTTAFLLILALLVIASIVAGFIMMFRKYQREKLQVELDALSSVQDERKQLRTLIDNIPDLIFIKDKESRFTMANTKVASVMNTTSENLIGKTDFDFYPENIARGFYEDEQKVIGAGIPMINSEETAMDERGNRIIRSTTKVPVRNKDGEIIGIAGVCRDITKLKQIENQLRKKSEDLQETNRLLEARQKEILIQSEELAEQTQSLLMINEELDRLNRTKDKFFSIIAHDLRNPFNAIIGFCELLRNDFHEIDNAQKLNLLELINVSSQTAYNLLENLLQWARTQTNRIVFSPEDFDLSETADAVIDLHCVIARKKGITLINNIVEQTMVHADKNMINTVLRNLVSNAIKFTNPEGQIIISVNRKTENVEVNIADDGVGMTREDLSKLFRIDTYYSTSGTMGESGTGLGLIICKEFVEKNNGRIKASSTIGEGTTMTFTLNQAKLN
jgi:PAS domain S-box-containing protein